MIEYELYRCYKNTREIIGKYKTEEEASDAALDCIRSLAAWSRESFTIFDFKLVKKEFKDTSDDFKEALDSLTAVGEKVGRDSCKNEEIETVLKEINPKYIKSVIAYNRLYTIAQAWNNDDGLEPDLYNAYQPKFAPIFRYDSYSKKFVYAYCDKMYYYDNVVNKAPICYTNQPICFKTSKRAIQFGKQFIDLWNDFLLNK